MSFGVFQFRRGTAASWTAANTVLAAGELAIETDTAKFKIGDGATAWNALAYGGLQGPAGVTPSNQITTNSTQTGLTGDKTSAGAWTFGKVDVAGGAIGADGVGVMDNGARVYSDQNPPQTLMQTETPIGSPPATPASGYAVQYVGDDGIFRAKNDGGLVSTMLSAADKARLDNNALGWVNILDFGADRTNAASSRTALTNAIAALPNGGVVFFPPGIYNLGNTAFVVATAHITLQGAARYGTTITTTSTTEDIINVNQWYVGIADLTFTGPGAGQVSSKTAGFAINGGGAGAAYTTIKRCTFNYQYDCINLANTLMSVDDIECRYFKHSGIVVSHNSDHAISAATMDNNPGALPTGSGIDVQVTASLLLQNCNIIHSNFALNISPANGVTVPSVKGVNCFFDTSAVGLNMTGAGSVFRSEFTNCWFSSMSTAGVLMGPTGTGTVDGLTFVNCDLYNNVGGTTNGIVTTTALVGKWKMVGCSVAGWTNGINLIAGANHFPTILSNTIGAVSAFAVNTTGIVVGAGAYKGLVISTNDVVNNTTSLTLGAATFTVAGQYRITDNAGINPRGVVTPPIATPVSATVYTNATGFRCAVVFRGVTLTAIAINGVAMGAGVANGVVSATLEPGSTIALTGTTLSWAWTGM